ncbi:MAG: methyltransferase domain-containing protein [Proteobacteria bacterium]|nr:methyltransferase domain-containing protein [Pseudomonadota bacterium]NBP15491.1 methyltransferase domain-containing protein [bacterium]
MNRNFFNWKFSETSKARHRLAKHCQGNGLDIGYGGDPIVPWAITVDKFVHDSITYYNPLHLHSDCKNLPFKDYSLDFIYSSHLLEDFCWEEIFIILEEWLRVIKLMGRIILYQPDQYLYQKHCISKGIVPNANHKEKDFSLRQFENKILPRLNVDVIYKFNEQDEVKTEFISENYCWGIVLVKR